MGKEAGFFGVRISKALADGAGPEKAADGYVPPPPAQQAQHDEALRLCGFTGPWRWEEAEGAAAQRPQPKAAGK